ncbi:MAG: DMT family transporter [Burkholderiaceae bacterium]
MIAGPWWVLFTLLAAASQTARNAMQRGLTGTIGTIGATQVRFLFGLPFSALCVAVLASRPGFHWPAMSAAFWGWTIVGATTQIAATALMLAAMRLRSFVVATAYVKTEPVLVALFGLLVLGEHPGWLGALAIAIACAGVMTMSWPAPAARQRSAAWTDAIAPIACGIGAGVGFALSSVAFRAAILALGDGSFVDHASVTLLCSLTIQTAQLGLYLVVWNRPVLMAILRQWRTSMLAGFAGALASQMWFLAFAIESAARVRTLGLVEILFAQIVSRRLFAQGSSRREKLGIAMVVAGVVALLAAGG